MTETNLAALAVHPDYLKPHSDQVSFKLPRLMYVALKARSLATGCSIGFVIRDCIRRGAPMLDQPLDVTGAGVPAQQEGA